MYEDQLLQIIEGCRRGHKASEKALFVRFAPKVLAIARRYAGDEPQALDFLQECFVLVFQKLGQYDQQKGAFDGWLYRVCVNWILQWIRKNKQMPNMLELPMELAEDDFAESDLEVIPSEVVLQTIRELPAGYKAVLNLFVFENWSHREIAAELGITESASRSQLARAKQRLKMKLQKTLNQYEQGLV